MLSREMELLSVCAVPHQHECERIAMARPAQKRPQSAARTRPAARRQAAARRQRRAQRPASLPEQMLRLVVTHPVATLAVVGVAGAAISTLIIRPDPRRMTDAAKALAPFAMQAMAPIIAAATPTPRHWWDDYVPGRRRSWTEDAAEQARGQWQEALATVPPRRWWEEQFSELAETVRKRLARL